VSAQPFQIFISYRRDDTADAAGRLYDALAAEFGDRIFMDIDTIEPGVDFVDVVHRAVGSCDVLLALIGSRWSTVADAKGRRRLDDPDDFVRMEIEAALGRDVRVIPILVQGADMPSLDDLPESLGRLARRNAVQISPARWHYDVGRLIETLRKLADAKAAAGRNGSRASKTLPPKEGDGGSRRQRLVVGVVAAAVFLSAGVALLAHRGSGSPTVSGSPNEGIIAAGEQAPPSHAVVEIDPKTGKVLNTYPNPGGAGFIGRDIAVGQHSLWVLGNLGVARLEEDRSTALVNVDRPGDLGVGTAGVWVTDGDHISQIDLNDNVLVNPRRVEGTPRRIAVGNSGWILTSTEGGGSALVRLDQDGSSTTLPLQGDDVVVPPSGVWVADTAGKKVVLIDRESVQVAGFVSIEAPDGIAPGDDGVWVYNTDLGTITEVHQDQFGTVVAATPIAIDAQPVDLSSGSGAVWTANLDGRVTKVVDGAVVGAFDLGAKVVAIRVESTTGRVFCLIG
jgi:hypothetical protein